MQSARNERGQVLLDKPVFLGKIARASEERLLKIDCTIRPQQQPQPPPLLHRHLPAAAPRGPPSRFVLSVVKRFGKVHWSAGGVSARQWEQLALASRRHSGPWEWAHMNREPVLESRESSRAAGAGAFRRFPKKPFFYPNSAAGLARPVTVAGGVGSGAAGGGGGVGV